MVAGRDKTGMPAWLQHAAWQTWLRPRASPVDRSVIGSPPDDIFFSGSWPLGDKPSCSTDTVQSSPEYVVPFTPYSALNLITRFAVLCPAVMHSTCSTIQIH